MGVNVNLWLMIRSDLRKHEELIAKVVPKGSLFNSI